MGAAESVMTACGCAQQPKDQNGDGRGRDQVGQKGVIINSPTLSSGLPWLPDSPKSSLDASDDAIQKAKLIHNRQVQHSFVSKDLVRTLHQSKSKAKGLEDELKTLTAELKEVFREEEMYRARCSKDSRRKDDILENKLANRKHSISQAIKKTQAQMQECICAAERAEENTVRGGGGDAGVPAFFRANRSVDSSQSQGNSRSKSPNSRSRAKKE